MSTLYISHPCFLLHQTPPGHPERPDRMRVVERILEHERFAALEREASPVATTEALMRAHPESYIRAIEEAAPREGLIQLDADTTMSAGTLEAALRASGGAILAVDEVMTGKVANAFSAARPPGHHAERATAMGFCFFNHAAVAARHAQRVHGAERVAIVDWDVHHGNGTQDIFWSDKDMFYGSTHQMPLFPGTGELSETGAGNIWNAPLRSGDGGETFRDAFTSRILGALHNFGPDLIVISAGFDAHKRDPLGGLQLVEADFIWATEQLGKTAERHCKGRIVSMLEGGYDLDALAKSVAVHVRTLMDIGS